MLNMDTTPKKRDELSPAKKALLERLKRGQTQKQVEPQAIPRRSPQGPLPLSFAQQRLWLLQQWDPGGTAYNISGAVRLSGDLDVETLEKSVNEIIRRHEILRTTFVLAEQQPAQVIAPFEPMTLDVVNLRGESLEKREVEARRLAYEEAHLPFDLVRGPLFRIGLLRLDEREHVLLLSMHHTVFDGWSQNIFVRELSECYRAFSKGVSPELPPLPIQYADYALWQRGQVAVHDAQRAFWKNQLADAPLTLAMPTDNVRPPVQTFDGARHTLDISNEVAESLKALSRREGVTMHILLLAAFKVFLFRYTNQTDIVIGTPVAGRNRPEVEDLIGVFINMLAMRSKLSADLRFREFLMQVRDSALEAYANQDVPFERLVEELNPQRDSSRTPIFQVAFALQNVSTGTLELSGVTWRPMEIENERARFDLTLFMLERKTGLAACFAYRTDLFKSETIERMLDRFSTLLDSIVESPDARLGELRILYEAERNLLTKKTAVDLSEKSFAF